MNTQTQGTLPLHEARTKFSLFHKVRKMGKKNILTGLLVFMFLWLVGACLFTVMAGGSNRVAEIDKQVAAIRGEKISLETQVIEKKETYELAKVNLSEATKKVQEATEIMNKQASEADVIRGTIQEKEQEIDRLIEEKAMLKLGFK